MNAQQGDYIVTRRERPLAVLTKHALLVFEIVGGAALGWIGAQLYLTRWPL